ERSITRAIGNIVIIQTSRSPNKEIVDPERAGDLPAPLPQAETAPLACAVWPKNRAAPNEPVLLFSLLKCGGLRHFGFFLSFHGQKGKNTKAAQTDAHQSVPSETRPMNDHEALLTQHVERTRRYFLRAGVAWTAAAGWGLSAARAESPE